MFNLLLIIVIAVAMLIFLAMGYVKSPPNTAYIISGMRKKPRILIGRAGIKIPFLERVDKLYLGQITVDIKTEQSVPTNDFINVNVDAVAKVRIGMTDDDIQLAAKNFLNRVPDQIADDLQDTLQGNMREIIGTLSLKAINTDRDSFSDQVMAKASQDMRKLGIEILSCNIQNITDEKGLIEDLGADNMSRITKDASIARAQADMEVAVAQAEADKQANDARATADLEIAKKRTDLEIKKAALKEQSDTAKAKADAAYEIQKQEQQKAIETNTVNAKIAKAEREAELKQAEVKVQEQTLEATVKKQAEADKYKQIQEAEAAMEVRKKEAEATKYAMEQEALGIKAKGEAEAEAIKAKGIAEAEAMEKKAEAYKKYNNMAVVEQMIKIMPQMAAEIAKPISQIDKINIYGGSDGRGGASQISGIAPQVMHQVIDTMSESVGVDMREIIKSNTYDAKVNKNINITGLEDLSAKDQVEAIAVALEEDSKTNADCTGDNCESCEGDCKNH